MLAVFIKAFAFIFIIALGYFLKRIHFFKPEDFRLVSRMILTITLPGAVVSSFVNFKLEPTLLTLILLGIAANGIMLAVGWALAPHKTPRLRAFDMINYSGYSIGCFALPFVQGFLGAGGVVATCLFDAGNAVMCTGATFSIATLVAGGRGRVTARSFLKTLFTSPPFVTYLIMLTITFLHIPIPEPVVSIASTIGAANPFLAMLMIGIGFEVSLDREYLGSIARGLLVRYGGAAVLAAGCYFLLPLPLEVRQVLVLLLFAPLSVASTAYSDQITGERARSSAMNSMSIVLSMFFMTMLLIFMHVA